MEQEYREIIYMAMHNLFNIDRQLLCLSNDETILFMEPFNLDHISLAYLILEIEKNLGIHLLEQSFDNYGLITIKGILDSISISICD